jgi:hypothetical protein
LATDPATIRRNTLCIKVVTPISASAAARVTIALPTAMPQTGAQPEQQPTQQHQDRGGVCHPQLQRAKTGQG